MVVWWRERASDMVLSSMWGAGIAAVIYAWVDARRGGWAILAIGVAFTIFALVTAGQRHWMAVLGGGVPFLLIGLLFLMGERGN